MRTAELRIRPFVPADAAFVWALHNAALDSTGAHPGNGPWDEDLRDPGAGYARRGGELLVGLIGEELIAMGALLPRSDREVELKRMRVAPAFQRRGFGSQMLAALEVRARELGYGRACLDTTTAQPGAQRFYSSQGYSEVRRDTRGIFELVLFEKDLTGASNRR